MWENYLLRLMRNIATPTTTTAPTTPPMIGITGRLELPIGDELTELTVSVTDVERAREPLDAVTFTA